MYDMSEKENQTPQEETKEETPELETSAEEQREQNAPEKKPEPKKKHERTPLEEQERALNKVKIRKKLKYGTLSTVITLVVLAIIVAVNVICNVLDDRYDWNIDLTSSGLYEIDEQSIEYLHKLDSDIDIAVMAKESYFLENSSLKVVAETLKRFEAESNGHITVRYIDMQTSPEAVKPYSDLYEGGSFSEGDIAVKCGDLLRVAPISDYVRTEQSVDYTTYQYVTKQTFVGEQTLISCIMGVTDLNPKKVAILSKQNGNSIFNDAEQGNYAALMELLEKNNYQTTEVDIALDALAPADYDIAILFAPYNDLADAQVTKLSDFLANEGNYNKQLIYFAQSLQAPKSTPNLDSFLEVWGLAVDDGLVYEGDDSSAQVIQMATLGVRGGIPVATTSDSTLHSDLIDSGLPVVAPFCRPVEQLYESNSSRTTEALLTTSDTSFLYPFDADETFDPDGAERTSFVVGAVGTQSFVVDNEEHMSKVVVYGSSNMLDYYVTASASYANGSYMVSVINQLTGKEELITIEEKSLDNTSITITDSQVRAISIIVIAVIPAAVALIGILVFVRRRNR